MAKRLGYKLVVIGLIFGLGFGFAIREVKRQIGLALVQMLEDEAFSSSGCHFVAENIEVSLLRERAVATNAGVECNDVPHLQFKRVVASFSLRRIRERIIDLELRLVDGMSLGFSGDSTTFKFIDSLAAPISPERDTPGRYKVKLQRLTLEGLEASERFGAVKVAAHQVGMEMRRTPTNDFKLTPIVARIMIDVGSRSFTVEGLSTSIQLEDEKILFEQITARMGASSASGELSLTNDEHSTLRGRLVIAGDLAQLSSNLTGRATLPIEISGPARFPTLRAAISSEALVISGMPADEQLSAQVEVEVDPDSQPRIFVPSLSVGFPLGSLSVTEPVLIDKLKNSGRLRVLLAAPNSGEITATVSGNRSSPSLSLASAIATSGGTSVEALLQAVNLVQEPAISGSGRIVIPGVSMLDFLLQKVDRSIARLSLSGADKSISGIALLDVSNGSGELDLSATSALIAQQVPCGVLNSSLKYRWNGQAMLRGDGALRIEALSGGCDLGATRLRDPIELPIQDGTLQIKALSIVSLGKPFALDGSISAANGIDVTAAGLVDLTTIGALIPSIDELSGVGEGKVRFVGSGADIAATGTLQLRDVRIEQAKAGIEIGKVTGPIKIANNVIILDGITGSFNGGTLTVNGELDLPALERSRARLTIRNAAFEPTSNSALIVSGDLVVEQPGGIPRISGIITVNNGEFTDSITISQILRILERAVMSREQAAASRTIPAVDLDVQVLGSRNLFVNTNLGAAELATDLRITGTLRDPQIRGDVTFRSGWIGFQKRRFEINSGKLKFAPPAIEPTIELIAETILPAQSGENVLVILQGSGTISSPRISLSSDQPITERELLTLVSSGSGFGSRTRANTLGATRTTGDSPLLQDLVRLRLRSFFSNLVDVDSLSISPIFNPSTGLIEPALVAEKLLAENLTLFGESTLSGVEGVARARIQLDLAEDVAVGGLVENDPARAGVPAELQITYTPLSRQARRVSVSLRGNQSLGTSDILASLRLSSLSFVTPQEVLALEEDLKGYYAKQGYPGTSVKIACDEFIETCTAIGLVIAEGAPRLVTSISISGTPLPVQIDQRFARNFVRVSGDQLATEQFRSSRIKELIRALRSEGYVGARAEGLYRCEPNSHQCVLEITLDVGSPISFVFSGNKQFTATQFLNAIRLFERNQPFGNNTIAVLMSTIERMYREQGRLFTTVSYETNRDASGRTNFSILIDESEPVKVARVTLTGLPDGVSNTTVASLGATQRAVLLAPDYPIAEEIEENSAVLTVALRANGYESAQVEGAIKPIGDTNTAEIVYRVALGALSKRATPTIKNWPTELALPEALITPDFPSQLAQRGELTISALIDAGYFDASAAQQSVAGEHADVIIVTAGARALIKAIEVRGNPTISRAVIIESTRLKLGDPLERAALDAARSRLLRLGLFSRVTVLSKPSGEVSIEVLERSPRSVEVGVGGNSEYGLHLFGEGTDRQIFGDGRQLAVRLDGYYDNSQNSISKGTASLQYRAPFVLQSNLGLSEDLRFQRFDLATLPYDLDRLSLASFLSGEESVWTYSFGHSLTQDSLDNVSPDAVLSSLDTGLVLLSSISGAITYDDRDAPLNPQSGFLLSLDGKVSAQALGSDANFIEASTRLSWAAILQPQWGVAYQLRLGVKEPLGQTDEIPITQRYFTGGRTSVRGYRENSLGPRGDAGSVLGGKYLLNQNAELRYKPLDAIALVGFIDSGTTFLDSTFLDSTSLEDVRHSTGLGIRYLSPVGPIGFDLGFPIARRSADDVYRLHFSIGTIF